MVMPGMSPPPTPGPGIAPPLVSPEPVSVSGSYGYDRTFFRRLYSLSKPYWVRKGCGGSWLTLVFLLSTVVAYSVCGAWITGLTKDQTNALVDRDPATFWRLLAVVALLTGMRYIIHSSDGRGQLPRFALAPVARPALPEPLLQPSGLLQARGRPDSEQRGPTHAGRAFAVLHHDVVVPATGLGNSGGCGRAAVPDTVDLAGTLLDRHDIRRGQIRSMVWIYNPVIEQNYKVVDAEGDLRASIRHVMTHAETVAVYGVKIPSVRSSSIT
jgi:vitamin B12/bleomycin/antimicrobial peptide transport system ATP-binding/permease protein